MFEGLPERLTKEIQKLTPGAASNKVKLIALPERNYATWIGASILPNPHSPIPNPLLANKALHFCDKCFLFIIFYRIYIKYGN